MAYGILSDDENNIKLVFFNNIYLKYKTILHVGNAIGIFGIKKPEENIIIVQTVIPLVENITVRKSKILTYNIKDINLNQIRQSIEDIETDVIVKVLTSRTSIEVITK